jgi:carnitine O-palmitoyltransferase 2
MKTLKLEGKFIECKKVSGGSIIPTLHFQKSLTKLKIPKLEDTFNRYLAALKPLLSDDEWKQAEKSARNFQNNEAQILDKEIRDLDSQSKHSNYISGFVD